MALLAGTAITASNPAAATEGYAAIGFGARYKALGGAGVADSRDATAASLNPAGLVHVGDEFVGSLSMFNPERSFSTSGPGAVITGPISVDSDRPWFFIPNLAISTRAFANPLFDVAAFTMVGNGGMNTTYPSFSNPSFFCGGGGQGAFCNGTAGVNLLQLIMSVAFAKQIAPGISVGVAPMMALQTFEARGLQLFNGFSTPGGAIQNGQNDWGYGFGVRGGIELQPIRNVRIGISGTSPFRMSEMNKYDGLFADNGNFDIPASLQAGIAVDLSPALTVMFDWRRIWYSTVDSVGNPSTNLFGCTALGGPSNSFCLGGANGPGFGWDDVDAFKFGVEYRANEKLTLRGGYAYNTQPIKGRDVTFNIIAPAVTQHHITGGFAYDLGGGYTMEMAAMYAPNVSVSGPDLFTGPAQTVTLDMHQYEVTLGLKYRWDEPAAPLK